MLENVSVDPDRLNEYEIAGIEQIRAKLVRNVPISPKQHDWLEALIVRLGHALDVGPVEDYAERPRPRTDSPPLDTEFAMGPRATKPPGRR